VASGGLGASINSPRPARKRVAPAAANSLLLRGARATDGPGPTACRRKHAAYRELSQRLERQQKLSGLAAKLDADKQLMGRGRKRKLPAAAAAAGGGSGSGSGSAGAVYKWKRERKR
jgi:hypothetical protein